MTVLAHAAIKGGPGALHEDLDEDFADTVVNAWRACGWRAASEGASAAIEIVRIERLITVAINTRLKALGLTYARFEVLVQLLFRDAPVGVRDLSDSLQVHPTSVSSALEGLENSGYVKIVPHQSDGRRVVIRLTALGRTALDEAVEILNRDIFSQLGLSSGEMVTFLRVLERLRANAGDF